MNGQVTRDMLVSGEQFGVGGADSVRGFLEREVSSDYGHRGTFEIYSPDFGGWIGISGLRARAVGFVDWGKVVRFRPAAAEVHGQTIASAGAGIRVSRGSNLSFRADYAGVVDAGGTTGQRGGPQAKGDARLHFSFSYVF